MRSPAWTGLCSIHTFFHEFFRFDVHAQACPNELEEARTQSAEALQELEIVRRQLDMARTTASWIRQPVNSASPAVPGMQQMLDHAHQKVWTWFPVNTLSSIHACEPFQKCFTCVCVCVRVCGGVGGQVGVCHY